MIYLLTIDGEEISLHTTVEEAVIDNDERIDSMMEFCDVEDLGIHTITPVADDYVLSTENNIPF